MKSTRCVVTYTWLVVVIVVALARPAAVIAGESSQSPDQTGTAKADPQSLYRLARQYAKGTDMAQNPEKAAEYMRLAAEAGYAYAQNDLGSYYARGFGVPQDLRQAAKWYRKGAEGGDALAQYSLGRCYAEGRGLEPDVQKAIRWYQKAADQKQPDALMALGFIYFDGQAGVETNYSKACRYFLQAANLGQKGACNSVGLIYETGGHGLKQDFGKALEYYRKAAQENDARGQMNLGRMFWEGNGVKHDVVEAYKWYYLASNNGDTIAGHYLAELEGNNPTGEPQLTPDQKAKAVKSANKFQQNLKQASAPTKPSAE